jgi:hypothetical protein
MWIGLIQWIQTLFLLQTIRKKMKWIIFSNVYSAQIDFNDTCLVREVLSCKLQIPDGIWKIDLFHFFQLYELVFHFFISLRQLYAHSEEWIYSNGETIRSIKKETIATQPIKISISPMQGK